MSSSNKKTLGILGGMGPLASEFFLRLITERTYAESDADHLDVVMTSFSSIPDRSDFILGSSAVNPVYLMKKCADILVYGGANIIAVPCNTASYYFDALREYFPIPIIDIVESTVSFAKALKASRVGILATRGTIAGEMYQRECERQFIEPIFPSEEEQNKIVNEIYLSLKPGKHEVNEIYPVAKKLSESCDFVLLGCTELSMVDFSSHTYNDKIIDSSRVLAIRSIVECGGKPTGFEKIYENYRR